MLSNGKIADGGTALAMALVDGSPAITVKRLWAKQRAVVRPKRNRFSKESGTISQMRKLVLWF